MSQTRLKKSFPVFDCDAHVNDPLEIWDKYVEPEYRELVKQSYWNTPGHAMLNGRTVVSGGHEALAARSPSTASRSAAPAPTRRFSAG
jgi:hypothetical protein